MKKTAILLLTLLLALAAAGAQAFTLTGLEDEMVDRDWGKSKFFPRMEALTGVAVTPQGISDEKQYADLLGAMEKGEVTTEALFKANLTRAQEIALLDAGAIIDLAPLIEENMPNLSALLAQHPQWRETIALEDGRIASLPLLNEKERQAVMWINAAWLEKLGLAMPQTVEELTAALIAIRDGDPNGNGRADEVGADLLGVYEMRWLLPFFGVVADDYHLARNDSGEIVFAPEMDGYRAFVQTLKDWNEQGVLRADAFTAMHSTQALSDTDEDAPVTSGMLLSVTPYTHMKAEAVADYAPVLIAGPDGRVRWRDLLGEVWTGCFAVTSACENPAEALRWADALYSEAGALLGYGGVEGEDYVYNAAGHWQFQLSGNRGINELRAQVLMYTGASMPGLYPADFIHSVDSALDRHVFGASERVRAVSERVTQAHALGAQDQAKAEALAAQIGELVDVGIARFATGETELTDETWSAWLAELKAAGSDELARLFQGAQ